MKKKLFLTIAVLFTLFSVPTRAGGFREFCKKTINKMGSLPEWVDTNYVGKPKNLALFTTPDIFLSRIDMNAYLKGLDMDLAIPYGDGQVFTAKGVDMGNVRLRTNTGMAAAVGVYAAYSGARIGYTYDLTKRIPVNFCLESSGLRFRFEFRIRYSKKINGKVDLLDSDNLQSRIYQGTDPTILKGIDEYFDQIESFSTGNLDILSGILNLYYIFNPSRFAYSAAAFPTAIQKKSAGSLIGNATIFSGKISTNKEANSQFMGLNRVDLFQLSAGVGYGYNYVPAQNWVLHASAIPMLTCSFKNNIQTSISTIDSEKMLDKYFGGSTNLGTSLLFRLCANYTISDNLIVGCFSTVNSFLVFDRSGYRNFFNDSYIQFYLGLRL